MSKMKETRKPGGGRKKLKPEYNAGKNLKEQMESAVALYDSKMSLQAIGDELGLNPITVRKLLITAGVYESEVAEKVKNTFEEYRETQDCLFFQFRLHPCCYIRTFDSHVNTAFLCSHYRNLYIGLQDSLLEH